MEGEQTMFGSKQAAKYLGMSWITVKYHIERGNLIGTLINPRARVFDKAELDRFLVEKASPGKPIDKDEGRYKAERESIIEAMNDEAQPEVARKARSLYLMYESDHSLEAASEAVGVTRQAMHNWHKAFLQDGIAGLAKRKRGRKPQQQK